MTEEYWKDVEGFEGLYKISNQGIVKSLKDNHGNNREKILKPQKDKNYLFVRLYKDGKAKKCYIQRLVANAFIPNSKNMLVINHKDGNTFNNKVDNLECFSILKDYLKTKGGRKINEL